MPIVIPKIKKKNTLKSFSDENFVVEAIVADTKLIPNYNLLRVDFELIRRICCLIENMIVDNSKNNPKISKKDVCIKVFRELFPNLTSEEVNLCDKHIEYLWNNNKIKAIPIIKKIGKFLCSMLKKQVA